MSKEVIMRDFKKITTDLLKKCTEQELIIFKHKLEREMNERMNTAEEKFLKGYKYKTIK